MEIDVVKKSYMFKIVKRALMNQYKWIKDVTIDEEDYEKYTYNIFLKLKIDPYMLAEENQWEVAPWMIKDPNYSSTGLSMFFKGRSEKYRDISDSIDDLLQDIIMSPAIPNDLRLPRPKQNFVVGSYMM